MLNVTKLCVTEISHIFTTQTLKPSSRFTVTQKKKTFQIVCVTCLTLRFYPHRIFVYFILYWFCICLVLYFYQLLDR